MVRAFHADPQLSGVGAAFIEKIIALKKTEGPLAESAISDESEDQ